MLSCYHNGVVATGATGGAESSDDNGAGDGGHQIVWFSSRLGYNIKPK